MTAPLTAMDIEHIGPVAVVTLNRPDAANALNATMASELADVASRCDSTPSVRAVVVTGTGRFFCPGGDVKGMARAGPDGVQREIKQMADNLHRAISTFARMTAPVVVAVNGVAAGAGMSIAVIGDLVFAAESATFTAAYTNIGLSPDGSSTYFLPRLIGLRRTQELFLRNRRLTAHEALEWGLVTAVVADDRLLDAAVDCAQQLAAGPTGAYGNVKRLLLDTFGNGLEAQMEVEGRLIAESAASPHGQEGIGSFVAKRPPRFD